MDDQRIAYLQMITETISRMSTTSAIFKGFAATIVAGVSAIAYREINFWVLTLSFLPVLAFTIMDIYHLRLERKFRFLYEQVRTKAHEVDFSMALTKNPLEIISAKARVWDCVRSPSIYLFYPMMIAVLGVVIYLKWKGII